MAMDNKHLGSTWEDHEREMREKGYLPPEREAEIRAEADIMCALIEARNEKKISQRRLEELTGVKNSTIHRMEKGENSPSISTMLKVLAPLGKTLKVVPIEQR
jgi:DNA-binding XRE family transcriptional regulator